MRTPQTAASSTAAMAASVLSSDAQLAAQVVDRRLQFADALLEGVDALGRGAAARRRRIRRRRRVRHHGCARQQVGRAGLLLARLALETGDKRWLALRQPVEDGLDVGGALEGMETLGAGTQLAERLRTAQH